MTAKHALQQDHELRIFRAAITGWAMGGVVFYFEVGFLSLGKTLSLLGILAFILSLSLARLFFFRPKTVTELEKNFIITSELIGIFLLIIYTGGTGSLFFWIYPIVLILYSIYFSFARTIGSALLTTLLYVLVISLAKLGLIKSESSILFSFINISIIWIATFSALRSIKKIQRQNRNFWELEKKENQDQLALANEQLQQKQIEMEQINEELLKQQGAFQFTQRQAELRIHELAYIRFISESLVNVFSLDKILTIGAKKVAQALSVDYCDIYLFDDERLYSYLKKEFIFENENFLNTSTRISPKNNRLADILTSQTEPLIVQGDTFYSKEYSKEHSVLSELLERYGLKSTLLLPVYHDSRLITVYGMNNTREDRNFLQNEIQLADTLVKQIENYIGRAVLIQKSEKQRQDSEKRASVMQMVRQLTQLLITSLESDKIFSSIVQQFADALGVTRCVLLIYEKEFDHVRLVGEFDRSENKISEIGREFPLDKHPMMKQIVSKKGIVAIENSNDPSLSGQSRDLLENYGIKSLIMAPIIFEDQVVGIISLGEMRTERKFNSDEINLITTLASESAIAIINYQLFIAGKKHTAEHQAIFNLMKDLSFIDSSEVLYETVVNQIAEAVHAQRAILALYYPQTKTYQVKSISDYRGKYYCQISEHGIFYKEDQIKSLTYDMSELRNERVVRIDDLSNVSDHNDLILDLKKNGMNSALLTPIIAYNKKIGLAIISRNETAHRFTNGETEFLQALVDPAAVVFHDHLMAEREKRRSQYWKIIVDFSHKFIRAKNLDDLFKIASDAIRDQLNYDNVVILCVDHAAQRLEIRAIAGDLRERFKAFHLLPMNRGMVGKAATQGRIILSNDVHAEPTYTMVDGILTRSEISIPIKNEEGRVEVILDVESNDLNRFDDVDVGAFEAIADQIGLVIRIIRKGEK